jgi:hypothetical protein
MPGSPEPETEVPARPAEIRLGCRKLSRHDRPGVGDNESHGRVGGRTSHNNHGPS